MMQIGGPDVAVPDIQRQKLKIKRAKRGECPECGTKLFKAASGVLGRMKKATPINEAGKCVDGRCLVCFPETKTEEEQVKKKVSIPRVLLCHTIATGTGANGTMAEAAAAMGGFSFDFNDDISNITLDRRIRTDMDELDNTNTAHSTSKDKYLKPVDHYDKVKMFEDGDSDNSLRNRMEEFLAEEGNESDHDGNYDCNDATMEAGGEEEHDKRKHREAAAVSEEEGSNPLLAERTSPTGGIMARWEAPPEQAPPRDKKQDDRKKQDVVNVFQGSPPAVAKGERRKSFPHVAAPRSSSSSDISSQRRGSLSGPRKPFAPSGMFIPPVTEEENSQEENDIILESPREESKKLPGAGKLALVVSGQEEKEEEADDDDVKPSAEIFFDSAALAAPNVEKVPVKMDSKTSGTTAMAAGDRSTKTEDSMAGFATVSSTSSHKISNEYTAYSSKLLLMLDHTEGDNEEGSAADMQMQEIQLGAVLAPVLTEDAHSEEMEDKEGASDQGDKRHARRRTENTTPTAESSHVPSEDGTHPQCSDVPEMLDEPVSPKIEEPELLLEAPKSPRKKPPPGLKPAPVSPVKAPASPPTKPHAAEERKMQYKPGLKRAAPDLSMLLGELQNGRTEDHEAVLVRLTECLWTQGTLGKQQFVTGSGIKILASTMWADMMVPSAERSAAELFLALVATSSPAVAASSSASVVAGDFVVGHADMEGLIDALLITMQTIIVDEELQKIGCRILCCLASSGTNDNDGTRSGACLTVLNAMDAHCNSAAVQEWGVRALFNQCVYSKHAETNLRILLSSRVETSGSSGGDVLERSILQNSNDLFQLRDGSVLEWACRLCWCLTATNESVAGMVVLRMEVLRELLHILEQCRSVDDASAQLQEAVLGLIANLLRNNQYRSFLGSSDVILLVLDTMHGNKEFAGVQVEACNVVANITGLLSPVERDEIVDAGVIPTIVGAIFAFPSPSQKARIQEPALRALVGLTHDSDIAKEEICEQETLSVLMQRCRLDSSSTVLQQEMLCNILASVYASDRWQLQALQSDSLGALLSAAQTYSNSAKIQEAVCVAFRNLSKNPDTLEALVRSNAVNLAARAMASFKSSRTIQGNVCCALWNICVGSEFGHQRIAETSAVQCIVTAIQTHLESYELVDVACGALWAMIHRSQNLGQQFFYSDSGVECVTCALVMHPRSTALLEKACGILSFTSATANSTTQAVISDGVSNVVETMRNNPRCGSILQYGAHFLRNTIIRNHCFVGEASGVLTVLINALKDFTSSDIFLREACYFIWTIAELSYDAKSKILAMGGMSVITAILDHKGGIPIVENAALGAFKELALESTRA